MLYYIQTSYNDCLMLCRKDGMGKEKGLLCWDITIPCKKTKHVHHGEKNSEQNAIIDASQLAQIQRHLNTVHYMVQSNTPNTQFEVLVYCN